MRQTFRPARSAVQRLVSIALLFALVLAGMPLSARPAPVEASHSSIKWPFPGGATWYISQGYNTSPADGWSHFNCDPVTLRDAISQTRSCNRHYQYKYSFDLKRLDGNTAGATVISPVDGTIRWIDEAFGGMSINLGDGYAVAFFHVDLVSGLAAGQTVRQGQVMGTVSAPGGGGNGGSPHIHLTVWQTTDGGNWSRVAVPFSGALAIDGYDFPALSDSTRNQHWQRQVVSTNQVIATGIGSAPGIPSLISPAMGTTYTTVGVTPTLTWSSVAGATEYQVVVNDGRLTSPWVAGTSWQMPALATGQYAWQVRSRNSAGQSNLSAKWVFWVDPPGGATPTPTPTPAPTGTPGPLGLTLNRTSVWVNGELQATGSGFDPGEPVRLFLNSASATAFRTVTAAGNGSFSSTFPMPEATGGNHTIIARGATSNKQASTAIAVTSTLTRTPFRGPPGTSIAVTVFGFGANEQVRINFRTTSGLALGTATTNANGTGSVTITMPEASSGWHDYVGSGLTSRRTAWGALLVDRQVTLSRTSGEPGTSVTVNARGFPANQSVTVGWNASGAAPGTAVCSGGSTDANGSYSCAFPVPRTTAGSYPVAVTTSDGVTSSATFSVSGPAGITVNPASGAVYTRLTVTGGGFSAGEQVRLAWNASATAWATLTADANGNIRWIGTIPPLSNGSHTLNARGLTSGATSSSSFTVTTSGGSTGSSMISPGTYRVTATIIGLVGHTTSNGHVITPFDHFVALPACTESSCPWLRPGSSATYVAPCGDNCFVRVVNPATNACSVAPVWDRGPWFINDNWWETPDRRILNTRSGAVNQLAQGYVGADAARDGLDVGFGLSHGIGISDVGYHTGNRAAIDLADGTWVDIGFAQAAGITTVVVSLLWQTGEDPNAAAAACGQGPVSGITLSPSSGRSGASVTVTGRNFRGNERVSLHLGSTSNPALVTVTAAGNGTFRGTFTIPSSAASGENRIHALGVTSGRRAAATFTVGASGTPTPTPTPVPVATPRFTLSAPSGPAGASVTLTGTGYGPNERVRVFLNTQKSDPLTEATTNAAGAFTATVVIPDVAGGPHRLHAIGFTSRLRFARTINITPAFTMSRTSGVARRTIHVTVANFGANEVVEFRWNGQTTAAGSVTTDASGKGRLTVRAPWVNGSHGATIAGVTSRLTTTASYEVIERVRLSPASGNAGSPITVRGTGFTVATTVDVYWNNVRAANLLCSRRTSSTYGTFTCTVTPPAGAVPGTHTIVAVAGGLSATASYTLTTFIASEAQATPAPVTPHVIAAPSSGAAGSDVVISGAGFQPNEPVTIHFVTGRNPSLGNPTTDASGAFTTSITLPADAPAGAHRLHAIGRTSKTRAAVTFTVSGPAQAGTPEAAPQPGGDADGTPAAGATGVPESTPVPDTTPEPAPDAAATPAPESTPPPAPSETVVLPLADTSVSAATADQPQAPETAGELRIGGEEGGVSLVTFQVTGVPAGSVVTAKLVLTGAGTAGGPGGTIRVLMDYAVDEVGATHASLPLSDLPPARRADGSPAEIDWLDPGVEYVIDVTGVVSGDGTLTFVIPGTPESAVTFASRETETPPRLIVTYLAESPS